MFILDWEFFLGVLTAIQLLHTFCYFDQLIPLVTNIPYYAPFVQYYALKAIEILLGRCTSQLIIDKALTALQNVHFPPATNTRALKNRIIQESHTAQPLYPQHPRFVVNLRKYCTNVQCNVLIECKKGTYGQENEGHLNYMSTKISIRIALRNYAQRTPVRFAVRFVPHKDFHNKQPPELGVTPYCFVCDYEELAGRSFKGLRKSVWYKPWDKIKMQIAPHVAIVFQVLLEGGQLKGITIIRSLMCWKFFLWMMLQRTTCARKLRRDLFPNQISPMWQTLLNISLVCPLPNLLSILTYAAGGRQGCYNTDLVVRTSKSMNCIQYFVQVLHFFVYRKRVIGDQTFCT